MRASLDWVTLLLLCTRAFLRTPREQAIVELALRQQLATYAQKRSRPRITPLDRAFWVALLRFWPRWRSALVIVKPDTVVRWHRKGFRLYWRTISKRGPGRPPISDEVQGLVCRLAAENGWRARKIQAELQRLGLTVSLATVSRYLPRREPDHGQRQRWATFLRNHKDVIAGMDFLVVPTLRFRLLYVWFVIDHGRRRILHFNVTAHPTAPWVIAQLREAFSDETAPSYLIDDTDSRPTQSQALGKLRLPAIFSQKVTGAIEHFRVQPKRTAYRSPWQNGTAEPWIGSARRERLDHVIVFDEPHLRRLLRDYVDYYNADRVHTELRDSPAGRQIERRPSVNAAVIGLPRVGGLHHRYIWREAA